MPFAGIAYCSSLLQGVSCSWLLLNHSGAPSLYFCISKGWSSNSIPTLGQPSCTRRAVKDGEPCSRSNGNIVVLLAGGFKRTKMMLSSSIFCLELTRSSFSPSTLGVNQFGVRAETWDEQHPKITSFWVSGVRFTFADPFSRAFHLPPPKSRPRSPGSFWMVVINSYCSLKPDHKFHSVIM